MGLSWWDIMQVVGPVAATAIGGPVAGMAVSGAMGAGGAKAKGGSTADILRGGAIGVGTGALGAGGLGKASQTAAGLAKNAAAKEGAKAAGTQFLKEGAKTGMMGMPMISPAAVGAGSTAMTAAGNVGKAGALNKFADLTKKSLGKNQQATGGMLDTVKSGTKTYGAVDSAVFGPARAEEQKNKVKFWDLHNAMVQQQQQPYQSGLSPEYQFGAYGTPGSSLQTLGFLGRY
jgi:hypothetical protein